MSDRSRVLALILIMAMALLLTTSITIWILYRTALEQEQTRLVETVKSQAQLIDAIYREELTHEEMYGGEVEQVVLDQVIDAHRNYEGFGETGEFTVAKREGDFIVFKLKHRHSKVETPEPVPFDSDLAEPMRRALSGDSGTVVGLDYRGAIVLAAFEPVGDMGLGIVAKIDLPEVQRPFWRAGLLAIGISLLVVFAGAVLLFRVSNPLVVELEQRSHQLEETVDALSESEERFRKTFELAGVGIAQVSLDGQFTDVNPQVCEITGYSANEIKHLSFQEITHPDDLDTDMEYARQLLAGEIDRYTLDKRYLRKDGSVVWVNLTGSVVRDSAGGPLHFIAVVADITARREAEAAVKRSLSDKEVLLQEIHHRVKNNMQVISSLLSLQAANIDDDRLGKLFQESQSRVRAMALIHEILYDSGDLSKIDLRDYVERLSNGLTRMYGADAGLVQLGIDAEGITFGIDEMVPCGLALSELISNSLKYAFPNGREGKIDIIATSAGDGINLVVCDDGVGIPEEIDIRKTNTMGMGLVTSLVERQLGGRLELDRCEGTCFRIFIPDPPRKAEVRPKPGRMS